MMVPDDRARVYHERTRCSNCVDAPYPWNCETCNPSSWRPEPSPLTVALLTANSLRNLAKRIEVVCPRNEGIADSVRALAADLTDFSLRDAS